MRIVNPIAKLGEDLASDYLRKQGYTIIERNFHAKGGEIDIIAIEQAKEPVLCFIEVKTRTSSTFGTPFEAITPWKLHFIEKTAIYYTILHKNLPKALRMDAIAVLLDKNSQLQSLEYLKNITG
jgi:putative endonuclease